MNCMLISHQWVLSTHHKLVSLASLVDSASVLQIKADVGTSYLPICRQMEGPERDKLKHRDPALLYPALPYLT